MTGRRKSLWGSHKGETHLASDSPMSSTVRTVLDARPGGGEVRHAQAVVYLRLRRPRAHGVVDAPVDAVAGDLVPRAERVGVVNKGPVRDAPASTGVTVAPEAVYGVEDVGRAELSGVFLLIPVPVRWTRWSC